MEQTKYDVFISYSRKDYVDEKNNEIPGNYISAITKAFDDADIKYWIDKKGIYCGDEFAGIIADAIESSSALVFVSSNSSNDDKATWTIGEIATAQEAKKKIIPVRIDRSRYHKSLRVRLNALDYIDLTSNPEEGLNKLVESIKKYIAIIQAENKRIEEEKAAALNKVKEEEIINDIKLACTKLNNEEIKIQLDRKKLLLTTQKIADKVKQGKMRDFILTSSPIRTESQEVIKNCEEENERLKKDLKDAIAERDFLTIKCGDLKKTLHWVYGCITGILLITLLITYFCSGKHTNVNPSGNSLEIMSSDSDNQPPTFSPSETATKEDDAIELFNKGKEYYAKYYIITAGQRDDKNLKKAFDLWKQAADKGLVEAQDSVGMCFYIGRGTSIDYGKAVKYFELAVAQGCIDAQYRLGLCYYNGCISGKTKTQVKPLKALECFESAAAQGHNAAICYAGMCYYEKKEYEKSYDLFEKAAKAGSRKALYYLGLHYHTGNSVIVREKEANRVKRREIAFDYFKQAAERGEDQAQYYVGLYYQKGYGNVDKKEKEAISWFKKAAKNGNNEAKETLKKEFDIEV